MRLPDSEEALVRVAAACSDEAVAHLIERYRSHLNLTVKRYASGRQDREDLVQDTIARLLANEKRSLRSWRPLAPFAAFLTTIAVRRGLRFLEEQARLPAREPRGLPAPARFFSEDTVDSAATEPWGDPERHVESAEQRRLVGDAVARLSHRDRLLIRWRFHEDLDAAQISRMLGISPGAARKAVFDAVRRLERLLDPVAADVYPRP